MKRNVFYVAWVFVLLGLGTTSSLAGQNLKFKIDGPRMFADLETLSADDMQGREPGSEGHRKAMEFIIGTFKSVGLKPFFGETYKQSFEVKPMFSGHEVTGVNLAGMLRGTQRPDEYIVVSAHFDHVGLNEDGQVFNGADDNASGVAALLEMGRYFAGHPPRRSIIFVAFDQEETGLNGAFQFVKQLSIPKEQIMVNINMDMISRNDMGPLYACGTHHYPQLKSFIESANGRTGFEVKMGYDQPSKNPRDNWTMLSDHAAFHVQGIPFIYFGVIDHKDYHKITDDAEHIDKKFYFQAVNNILETVLAMDLHVATGAVPRADHSQ